MLITIKTCKCVATTSEPIQLWHQLKHADEKIFRVNKISLKLSFDNNSLHIKQYTVSKKVCMSGKYLNNRHA